jgi:hypothetical protein
LESIVFVFFSCPQLCPPTPVKKTKKAAAAPQLQQRGLVRGLALPGDAPIQPSSVHAATVSTDNGESMNFVLGKCGNAFILTHLLFNLGESENGNVNESADSSDDRFFDADDIESVQHWNIKQNARNMAALQLNMDILGIGMHATLKPTVDFPPIHSLPAFVTPFAMFRQTSKLPEKAGVARKPVCANHL